MKPDPNFYDFYAAAANSGEGGIRIKTFGLETLSLKKFHGHKSADRQSRIKYGLGLELNGTGMRVLEEKELWVGHKLFKKAKTQSIEIRNFGHLV